MAYLYTGSVTLVIFIFSLIAGKKSKGYADYILMLWLVLFLLNVVTLFLVQQDGYTPKLAAEKMLFEFSDASILLHGPFLWFYTIALTQPRFLFKPKYLLHGALFLIGFLYLVSAVAGGIETPMTARKLLIIVKMLSLLGYTVATLLQLKKHRQTIQHIFSNTEERQLSWLYFLCWGILAIWAISCVSLLLSIFSNMSTPEYVSVFPNLAICLFIYLMGYFGVRQSNIFIKAEPLVKPIEKVAAAILPKDEGVLQEEKYKKSGLNKAKADKIYADLADYMQNKKPYLDADISLFNLAEMLHVQTNHLSQVINEKENLNFFDYINGFRVNAVKQQILDGKLAEHTLLGIAYDCGFNSKASFNRAFKKYTGVTPTEFKNQQK